MSKPAAKKSLAAPMTTAEVLAAIQWIAPEVRQAIYKRDRWACLYCGARPSAPDMTLDHVHPRALGGAADDPRNLVTACVTCNSTKRDMTLRTFLFYLEDYGKPTVGLAARVIAACHKPLPVKK